MFIIQIKKSLNSDILGFVDLQKWTIQQQKLQDYKVKDALFAIKYNQLNHRYQFFELKIPALQLFKVNLNAWMKVLNICLTAMSRKKIRWKSFKVLALKKNQLAQKRLRSIVDGQIQNYQKGQRCTKNLSQTTFLDVRYYNKKWNVQDWYKECQRRKYKSYKDGSQNEKLKDQHIKLILQETISEYDLCYKCAYGHYASTCNTRGRVYQNLKSDFAKTLDKYGLKQWMRKIKKRICTKLGNQQVLR